MTSPYIGEGKEKHCKYCERLESEWHREDCSRPGGEKPTTSPIDASTITHRRSSFYTWTVKYQYQLPGKLRPGEVRTEDVTARSCSIIDNHLIFEDSQNLLLRAFAPGRWIEVKLKDE